MDRHHLEAFLAVAEELHFGRAARRLHLAQPPLSRTIKQLERDLGTQLFDRTTRAVCLTSAGAALMQPARDALEAFDFARRAAVSAGRGSVGKVSLGFAGPSSYVLVGQLSRLARESHPGIELTLRSSTYAGEALQALEDGELDLAIVRWTIEPPGLDHRPLGAERYVVVVPDDHRLAACERVDMEDLREERFIALPATPGSSMRDALIRNAEAADFTPRIVQTAPDSWTAMALVGAGIGITLTVDVAMEHVITKGIRVVPINIPETASRLAWRRSNTNPALPALLQLFAEAIPFPK